MSGKYQFSPTGFYAAYKGSSTVIKVPVEAWDADGYPLIFDKGRLRLAERREGLIGVYRCGTNGVVIPAEPGWTVRYVPDSDKETGVSTTVPVVAWKINEIEHEAVPITIEHESDWPDEWMDTGMRIDRVIPPAGAYPILGIQGIQGMRPGEGR
ncbi:hypothetical protein ACIQOV_13185 [Kitasatospora sp. NPDC091257]|uniref:hypothetical protein n=1 Tax=Kitasatospora sp. NPDC091257 TaxID=3364084 RepID=UPI0038291CBB